MKFQCAWKGQEIELTAQRAVHPLAQAEGLGGVAQSAQSAQRAEFPQPRPTAWVGEGLGLPSRPNGPSFLSPGRRPGCEGLGWGGLKGRVSLDMNGGNNG